MRKKTGILLLLICFMLSTIGCGSNLPFEYRYTSANAVEITYQGKLYRLNRFGPKTRAPFDYAFESDGDLDIRIGGKTWDIDSPYDLDRPEKPLQ